MFSREIREVPGVLKVEELLTCEKRHLNRARRRNVGLQTGIWLAGAGDRVKEGRPRSRYGPNGCDSSADKARVPNSRPAARIHHGSDVRLVNRGRPV